MDIQSIITLEDDAAYELLDKTIYQNNTYFLAELVDENEEGMGQYKVFKQIKENDDFYVETEEQEETLFAILKNFNRQFTTELANLKPEDLM